MTHSQFHMLLILLSFIVNHGRGVWLAIRSISDEQPRAAFLWCGWWLVACDVAVTGHEKMRLRPLVVYSVSGA